LSNVVFPSLRGFLFPEREVLFSTIVQTSQNAREVRVANQSEPRYRWNLSWEFLSLVDTEDSLRTLQGFYESLYGSYDSFLWWDQNDNATVNPVTGARTPTQIGVGDGTTTAFQLSRTWGGFAKIIRDINTTAYTPIMYVSGVATSAFTLGSTGVVTFSSPPAAAAPITADFDYYFRAHFEDDSMKFTQFTENLFEVKDVSIISTING
jgi:uncharacterized protein (TIGR02217 family)